jgi:hypothetical protein
MTPGDAINRIETDRFAALTNLASNLKTFLPIAAQQPEVEALASAMAHEPAVTSEVLQRALALSAIRAEREFDSAGAAALATDLWLLSNHRHDLAETVAGNLREPRQFFWPRKLADELRLAHGSAKGNGREAAAERTELTREEAEALHRKA